jgi:hypothetical protein
VQDRDGVQGPTQVVDRGLQALRRQSGWCGSPSRAPWSACIVGGQDAAMLRQCRRVSQGGWCASRAPMRPQGHRFAAAPARGWRWWGEAEGPCQCHRPCRRARCVAAPPQISRTCLRRRACQRPAWLADFDNEPSRHPTSIPTPSADRGTFPCCEICRSPRRA